MSTKRLFFPPVMFRFFQGERQTSSLSSRQEGIPCMFVIMCGNYLCWTLAVDSPATLELLQAVNLDGA